MLTFCLTEIPGHASRIEAGQQGLWFADVLMAGFPVQEEEESATDS